MDLKWTDIDLETPMRDIGWVYVSAALLTIFVAYELYTVFREEKIKVKIPFFNRCRHFHTRCMHGDEVLQHIGTNRTPRQICMDCGDALDRRAICTATGINKHEWNGSWPYERDYHKEV